VVANPELVHAQPFLRRVQVDDMRGETAASHATFVRDGLNDGSTWHRAAPAHRSAALGLLLRQTDAQINPRASALPS
jgi:hypothetical protein